MTDMDVDGQIINFCADHNLDPDDQALQLVEEVGELAESVNRMDQAAIHEECADIRYVARSIELMFGGDPNESLRRVTAENATKNGEKDGNKVTKE